MKSAVTTKIERLNTCVGGDSDVGGRDINFSLSKRISNNHLLQHYRFI